jgi:AcrR family transcriptional regulator
VDAASLLSSPAVEFRQERSRRSYEALVEAAAMLFARAGYDPVGTPDIAAAAKMATGTFYRYFPDKLAIYLEVARRAFAAAYAATLERLTPQRFAGRARHETIAATVALLFEHILREPALWASFDEMSTRDRAVGELRRKYDRLSCDRLSVLIAAITSRDVIPDPDATAYVLYGAAIEAAHGMAGFGGKPPVSVERARAALAMVVERTLFP